VNKKTSQLKYQIVIIFTLGVFLYYLVYRFRYTINPDVLWLSIIFLYADVHGFISLSLFAFQLWNPIERKPPEPPPDASVDVFITTYNEEISVLKKTVLVCNNMRYPHKTYILDDGNRPELAKAAAEWGCGYITRKERLHAKAGNLNHALQITDGEFVVILDTDCVPQPDFLERTLGYFRDNKVAFVQTPHNYYNVDSFQFRVNMKKERLWNEQHLFYRLIMAGRDYWNSAFFAGTAAVFRKKALVKIGGFATGSITEDLHTTIHLYANGWKGVYHNEILSNELAAKDVKNYHTQTLRWAEGNMSMFYKCNPLFRKGLTIPQRICFAATIFGWLYGIPKLIYISLPILGIFGGLNPIKSFDYSFVWRCSFFLIALIAGFEYITRGYGKIVFCELYTTLNFFVSIKAMCRSFFRLKQIFKVTGKSATSLGISDIIPQLILCLLSFAGGIWAALKLYYGLTFDWKGVIAAIFWTTANGLLALSIIEKVTRPIYKRKEFRFIGAIPVRYSFEGETGSVTGIGVTKDVNEQGVSLFTFTPLPVGKSVLLNLYLGRKVLPCKASILHAKRIEYLHGSEFFYGARFDGLAESDIDLLCQYCFNTMLPRFRHRFDVKQSILFKKLAKMFNREKFRGQIRRKITHPLIVRINEKTTLTVVSNDVSTSGLSFISHASVEPESNLDMEIFTPLGTIIAKGKIKRVKEITAGDSYLVGVQLMQISDDSKKILMYLAGRES